MKRISTQVISILLMVIGGTQGAYAQGTWQWGKRGGSANPATNSCCFENAADIATDKNGNIYVLGNANMGINVDGHNHAGYGNNLSSGNVIIASWSCNGTFRWMKVVGSYTSSAGRSLRTDTLGGVYLSGYTISNNTLGYTHFDSDTALGNTNKSMFVVKYDTSGNYKWLRMPQADTVGPASITYSGVVDMDVAPNGESFIFCYLNPGIYSGTFVVTAPGIYVYRYSATGAFLGATPLNITIAGGSGGGGNLYNIQQSRFKRDHANGRYYVSGHYDAGYGTMTFGTTAVTKAAYLGSFSATGAMQWVKQSSTTNPAYETAGMISGRPATDEQNNIYITGNTFHGQSFNGHTFSNTLTTVEWPCPFVMKLDVNGNKLWATNASVIGAANGLAIAAANGDVAITGSFYQDMQWGGVTLKQGINESSDVFLARLNAQTGSIAGIDTLKSSYGAEEVPAAIERDKRGNYYVSGKFFNDLIVGPNTLNNIGGESDWFVAKFGSASCSCTLPVANYTNTVNGNTLNFTYTGSTPVDSVVWNFGNGERGTGTTISKTYAQSGTYNVCVTTYNSCGSNTYCKNVSTAGVGFADPDPFGLLSIYPNPAKTQLFINGLQEPAPYNLYNSIGSRVQEGQLGQGQAVIDMAGLAEGWYIIELLHKTGAKQRIRIIKQ
ncbi:PKD domain-containing protein [Taibaiella chishuiensis]|uniref:Putative secreted protein (Por secretion system target) n=1 Tax=Taibaiella chishuiensis TaxID=1434707 RepID=A0A2P8CXP2_9BACT|nr:PKD domain-containing protein [Taibaiella chishuiensis]PSK89707.1 putative secreted protein (Por secretion system target) [Taibaiella chishuiensis]